jgi:hypothetical protein
MEISARSVNFARALWRGALAVAVAYVFVSVLLVATAQQKVGEALAADNVGYDYNVAVRYYFGKESLAALRGANSAAIKAATDSLRRGNDGFAGAQRNLGNDAADLQDDLQRLSAAGCGAVQIVVQANPEPASLLNAAATGQHCDKGPASAAIRPVLAEVNAGATAIRKDLDDAAAFNRDVEDDNDQLKLLQEERQTLAGQAESAGKASGIIAILRIFEDSRWPLLSALVYVPPSLTAIVLAFVSGLFGALLITLVLFVYPDNRFNFTRSATYEGRILLGGLIALGVFVLLYSGVAVLGGASATGSNHNLMAYSAFGILSGMFSDQAAGWLSDRAAFSSRGGPSGPPPPDEPAA